MLEASIDRIIAQLRAISLEHELLSAKEVLEDLHTLKTAIAGAVGKFVRITMRTATTEEPVRFWSGFLEGVVIPPENLVTMPDFMEDATGQPIIGKYRLQFKLRNPTPAVISINLNHEAEVMVNKMSTLYEGVALTLMVWREATKEERKLFLNHNPRPLRPMPITKNKCLCS